jgi:putative colanic acid biosynthesis UDP-glucose lipid carrier transferase
VGIGTALVKRDSRLPIPGVPRRARAHAFLHPHPALDMTPMLTGTTRQAGLSRGQLSWSAFVRMTLDPLLAVLTYIVVGAAHREPFVGRDLILCLIVFSLMFPGDVALSQQRRGLLKEIAAGWAVVLGILFFFGWATNYLFDFYWDVLVAWAVSVPFVLYVAHRSIPVLAPKLLSIEGYRTAVIVGANDLGKRLARQFELKPLLGVKFEGFFDDRTPQRLGIGVGEGLKGRIADLPEYVKRGNVGAIFVALPMTSQPRILSLLESLYDTTASIYFVPDIFIYDLIQARIDDVDGIPIVAVCESPFYGVNAMIKRLEDIVLSALILVLIAPLLVAVAIGVKLSSPGPIIFRQRRYGLDGKEIFVWKFRSMRVMEDGGEVKQATREDPRITPFGAFIRRTSLDELPQFINVLQGRMSIVGPRPHAVAHNEQYRRLIRGYMIRHKVKPGITGLAQVNGLRGETETVDKMKARVEYDLEYLRNWSLRLDLAIIMKTFVVAITGRNAY